jgi:hypothetical protein
MQTGAIRKPTLNRALIGVMVMFCLTLSCKAQGSEADSAAFINEVLDAKPTRITPLFDSYHAGSYFVMKQDLLDGIVLLAKRRGLRLRCVSIIGPIGILWAYYVTVVFEEAPGRLSVNSLAFPHARITSKRTGTLTERQFSALIAALRRSGVLRTKKPPPQPDFAGGPKSAVEYSYEALLALWRRDNERPSVQYGKLSVLRPDSVTADRNRTEAYVTAHDQLVKRLTVTYPVAAPKQRRPALTHGAI